LGNLGAKVRAVCEFEFDIFLQHPFTPVLDGDQRHVKVFPSVILTRYQSDAGWEEPPVSQRSSPGPRTSSRSDPCALEKCH
jgi:hypothetical protein